MAVKTGWKPKQPETFNKVCKRCRELKAHYKSRPWICGDCFRDYSHEREALPKYKQKRKAYNKKHKEKISKNKKTYNAKVSEYRATKRRIDPEFRENEIRKNKQAKLKTYGLTLEDFARMLEDQGGVCAICHEPPNIKRMARIKDLSVDHDHETGKVRALLCYHCNAALGHLRDSPQRVYNALRYLLQHGKLWI